MPGPKCSSARRSMPRRPMQFGAHVQVISTRSQPERCDNRRSTMAGHSEPAEREGPRMTGWPFRQRTASHGLRRAAGAATSLQNCVAETGGRRSLTHVDRPAGRESIRPRPAAAFAARAPAVDIRDGRAGSEPRPIPAILTYTIATHAWRLSRRQIAPSADQRNKPAATARHASELKNSNKNSIKSV